MKEHHQRVHCGAVMLLLLASLALRLPFLEEPFGPDLGDRSYGAMRILEPGHPLFHYPNRITESDFGGWAQERGLYFLSEWDDHYLPLLEMSDPGEEGKRGGLLVAPLGEGGYAYTGLAFFRQFPAGVPGAFRLFANLISLKGADPGGSP